MGRPYPERRGQFWTIVHPSGQPISLSHSTGVSRRTSPSDEGVGVVVVVASSGVDGSGDDELAVGCSFGVDGLVVASLERSHNEMGLILSVAGGEVAEPLAVVLVAGSSVDGLLWGDEVALGELLESVGEAVGAGW